MSGQLDYLSLDSDSDSDSDDALMELRQARDESQRAKRSRDVARARSAVKRQQLADAKTELERLKAVLREKAPERAAKLERLKAEKGMCGWKLTTTGAARAAAEAALRRHNQLESIREAPEQEPEPEPEPEPEEPEPEYICSICQDECGYNPIKCGHHFHTSCIIKWMQSGRSLAKACPYCRVKIRPV
jgi:hypothetical protein